MGQDYEKVLAKCFEKVNYMNDRLDGFPHITRKSSWLTNQNGHWTGGFWIGLLWLERIMNDDSGTEPSKKVIDKITLIDNSGCSPVVLERKV